MPLRHDWRARCVRLGLSDPHDRHAQDLLQRYAEAHRHYHTTEHLAACLAQVPALPLSQRARDEVAMALWFHDAIYDPKSQKNEADSAELAQATLASMGADEALRGRIAALIMLTAGHKAPKGDVAGAHLIDVDLSVLGGSIEAYATYEVAIAREYAHVPRPLYRWGRRRVLKGFLKHPHIFNTPGYRAALEANARRNLMGALRG